MSEQQIDQGLNTEQVPAQEQEIGFNSKSIAITTGTFYPTWYSGEVKEPISADKLRGDLALQTMLTAQKKGLQTAIVDGGSSEEYLKTLTEHKIPHEIQKEKGGQGPARRQAIEMVEHNPKVKVICTTEPEKVSLITDEIAEKVSIPILNGEADIVIPWRNPESFSTYPSYQVEQEQDANRLCNRILRARGLLKPNQSDIDFWFGMRFMANRPEVTNLFKKVYEYRKSGNSALDKIINVEMYSNPLWFPIAEALHRGLRVASIPVFYRHPQIQSAFEKDKPEFNRKRDVQKRIIITELTHFIKMLESSPRTRLSQKNRE